MAARALAAFAVFDFVHRNRANVAPVVKLFSLTLLIEEVNNQRLQIGDARSTIADNLDRPIPQFPVLKERSAAPVRGDRNQLAGFCFEHGLQLHLVGDFDVAFFESVLQEHDGSGKQFFPRLGLL